MRRRYIVDNVDYKGCRGSVAIGIRYDNLKVVGGVVARGIVGQRVAVAIVTWSDAGYGKHAVIGGEGLANRRNVDAI